MATREILDFSRHNEAAVRLYLQHWMFQSQTGWLLHPDIPVKNKDLKLMDVACGTGIWLIDVAKQLPDTARLDGFDISDAHFPPKHELPSNVHLRTHDVLKPLPEEFHGQYDIVHIGRINFTVRGDDPGPVLKNIVQLLKPGGYLQWDDLDVGNMRALKPTSNPDLQTPHSDRLQHYSRIFFAKLGCGSRWLDELPEHFKKHGIVPSDSKRIEIGPGYTKPWTSMQMMANRDYVEHDLIPGTAGVPDMPTETEWREMVDGFDREAAQGLRVVMDIVYSIGRKD